MRALLALVLVACGSAPPACPVPVRAPDAPVLMWHANKPGSPPLVVFGTLHNAGSEHIAPSVRSALERSQVFVSETGDLEPDGDRMRELVRTPEDQPSLQQQLSDDDWYELRDALRGAIKEDELKRMRPWYAMARLRATVAPPPKPTMDAALTELAQQQGKVIVALEKPDEQLGALADAVTVADLVATLHERTDLPCRLNDLLGRYLAGDLNELERRLVTPEVRALLGPRNRTWMTALQAQTGPSIFVAVGLGHLLGPDSLLVLLERDGYVIARSGQR